MAVLTGCTLGQQTDQAGDCRACSAADCVRPVALLNTSVCVHWSGMGNLHFKLATPSSKQHHSMLLRMATAEMHPLHGEFSVCLP